MTITILDVENTVTTKNGKSHLDPFERTNSLVMVGVYPLDATDSSTYIFDHCDITKDDDIVHNRNTVQRILDETTTLVGHNISHDLLWLWESGFIYTGRVYDTMLSQHILNRGLGTTALNLAAVAEHYRCQTLKQDTLKVYFKKGYSTRDIPRTELENYLKHDLGATKEIYQKQTKKLINSTLLPVVQLTNEVAYCLSRMYQNGFKIDRDKLKEVRKEFEDEKLQLETDLQKYTKYLMGDTPINLNSPEQLSWVLFSRKPLSKSNWLDTINNEPYMDNTVFKVAVKKQFKTIYKTKAKQCTTCKGKGSVFKIRKDGSRYKKPTKCKVCDAKGFILEDTKFVAGLKFSPSSIKWASANGFKTSKSSLEMLSGVAHKKEMTEAKDFLDKLKRLSAITSYLSNFVDGIDNFMKEDSMLHVKLNQHITTTGRFSGSNPNMQNIPRGSTFPVKKVFVSRFEDGQILEADFAQLEFRVAAYLSQDETAIKEVVEGFDVHSYTAKIISDAGQPTTRQVAKTHTFAPLYGATGYGRTPAEAKYYEHFLQKYKGIARWHKVLANEAITKGAITTPSGRQFAFPDCTRRKDGSVSHFTQIKNYPVQSFATADIVPLVLVEVTKKLTHLKSIVVNSVHDSLIIDVHPTEVEDVTNVIKTIEGNLVSLMRTRWGIKFNVPLKLDMKIGNSWLEQTDI